MAATGQAALATVSGYSGIGKSSLVDALRKPIVAKHGYFISGKFDQYQRDIPYATLTQAFRELVQQLLAESEARIAGWRQQMQAAVGVNGQLIRRCAAPGRVDHRPASRRYRRCRRPRRKTGSAWCSGNS